MGVLKNYLWNLSYQLFVLILPLITIPYVSRVIGPEGIGVNAYTNSIVQYFILLGSLGFTLYGNREIAYARGDKQKVSNIFLSIFLIRLLTMGISIALFLCFALLKNDVYLLIQIGSLIGAALDISWFFMGMENFKVTVLRSLLVKIVSVICIFTFVKSERDLGIYIAILAFSTLLGNLTMFPYLKKYITVPKLKELNPVKHLKSALILFIPQVSINVYIVLNKTMLGIMSGVTAVGFYDNSDKIVKLVLTLVTSLGVVMLPHISSAFSKKNYEIVYKTISNSMDFVLFLSTPLMFGLAAIASKFAIFFFGADYTSVGPLIMCQSISLVFMSISNVIGTQYLLPSKRNKEYTTAVTLGAIINLICNFPLIYLLGPLGAVISSVFSELGVVLFELKVLKREMEIVPLFNELWKFILLGSAVFIVVFPLNQYWPASAIHIILEIIAGMVVYIIGVSLLKPRFLNVLKQFKYKK